MANLNEHKAGNGGYSQGDPNVLLDSSPTRRRPRSEGYNVSRNRIHICAALRRPCAAGNPLD